MFDAEAECEGTSLNMNLLTGSDVANNLVGVLLGFRQEKIAFPADIEKMFHQIRVREEDQDFLRFLWGTNGYDNPLINTSCKCILLERLPPLVLQIQLCSVWLTTMPKSTAVVLL